MRRQLPAMFAGALCAILVALAATSPAAPQSAVRAGPRSAAAPAAPKDIVAGKAFGMLERSCARCHQAGRLEGGTADGGIANLLALEEVARDPALVRPGLPDASRIYAVALTAERHQDIFNDPAATMPTAAEVQALRDWIGELRIGPRDACAARRRLTAEEAAAAIGRHLSSRAPETARQTRYVSLAHHWNACATPAELETLRAGLHALLAAVALKSGARSRLELLPVDQDRLVFAVPLVGLGWNTEQWEKIAGNNPLRSVPELPNSIREATGTSAPLLQADWLAHVWFATRPLGADHARDAVPTLWGLPATEALAHAWRRPAGLDRFAADLWLSPQELEGRLDNVAQSAVLVARQLSGGGVARRAALARLVPVLTGKPGPAAENAPDRLEIAIWPNAAMFRTGDAATFNVASSRDCYLTLINVDRSGRATVLFPNELEPANRLARDTVLKVPADNAHYRFRFKEKGQETMVAICSTTHPSPAGIVHQYDRLRFTVLGDWQLFLREPPELKDARRDDAATDRPGPKIRQRGRAREAAPGGPDVQTRTAITIDVQ